MSSNTNDPRIGQVIQGKYRLVKCLGRGGTASVYRADHISLQETVAIKLLHRQFHSDPEIHARLIEEAKIQHSLLHPHIVHVTDIVESPMETGLVMEWVDGDNLRNHTLSFGPLTNKDIWRISGPLLEGLSFAHQRGFIHRDIKPANILLHQQGHQLIPKLSDFGVAKVLDDLGEGYTQTGMALGTIRFMPPEQIIDSKNIDLRVDIYAFGATLYFMTTKQFPFQGGPQQVLFNQMHGSVTPPRHHNPMISEALEHVILRCMAKDPDQRYASCAVLSHALALALVQGEEVDDAETSVATPSQIYRQLQQLPEGDSVYTHSIGMIQPAVVSLDTMQPAQLSQAPAVGSSIPASFQARSLYADPSEQALDDTRLSASGDTRLSASDDTRLSASDEHTRLSPPEHAQYAMTSQPQAHSWHDPQGYHPPAASMPAVSYSSESMPSVLYSAESMPSASYSSESYSADSHSGMPYEGSAPDPTTLSASLHGSPPQVSPGDQRLKRQIGLLIAVCVLLFVMLLGVLGYVFRGSLFPGRGSGRSVVSKERLKPLIGAGGACVPGKEASCFDGPSGAWTKGPCRAGVKICTPKGVWGPCKGQVLPKKEDLCDGVDNDCDGKIDQDYPKRGKRCRIRVFQCSYAGRYVCAKDQRSVSCQRSGGAYRRGFVNVRLRLSPASQSFQLQVDGKPYSARRRFCVGGRAESSFQIKHPDYYACSFKMPRRSTSMWLTLKRRNDGLDPSSSYCRK